MLERLKWLVAGKELRALHRYRMACALAWRWNGQVPNSSETAEWISQVGEDQRGADISEFRARLGSADKAIESAAAPVEVDGDVSRAEYVAGAVAAAWCKHDLSVREHRCKEAATMIRTLARQLEEAKAENERLQGLNSQLVKKSNTQIGELVRLEEALAAATRRVAEVEGLVRKWRKDAHDYRFSDRGTDLLIAKMSDELEAALQKEPK